MFVSVSSAALSCAEGQPIQVEVTVGPGLPGFSLVGRPDVSIRESRDRARAAIANSGLVWPNRKITVNLAPSSDKKTGSGLDLAIAVGVLAASETLPVDAIANIAFIGELGLDGSLRAVNGTAPMVGAIGERDVVVPVGNANEARAVAAGTVRLVANLAELVAALQSEAPWPDHEPAPEEPTRQAPQPDLRDVQGQPVARQALEVAAAGGHHTLFVGPPGSGKTMLAARLPGLLPDLDRRRALEVTMLHSVAGLALPQGGLVRRPPFRSPHHTMSQPALVGGGSHMVRPGEASLAHCGVLFMDEFAEYAPSVLDGLREPLEDGTVHVDRTDFKSILPAAFLLVAAMNPCPCGGGPPGDCICGDAVLHRYARRVSGPLLDRFDLRVPVHRPAVDDLLANVPGESSAAVAQRVAAARELAIERQGGLNRALAADRLEEFARLDEPAAALLRNELEHGRLSGRGYHRVRRVARTLADLRGEASHLVAESDVALALRFRASIGGRVRSGWAA